jgi:hypothetical protein
MNLEDIKDSQKLSAILYEKYIKNNFGTMSKRDIEILVIHALCVEKVYSLPRDLHRACRELKISESKLRGLIRDSQLRYNELSSEEAKERFVEVLENGEVSMKGTKLAFVIRDPLLRLYLEEWLAETNSFVDTSFNPNVITVSSDSLSKIILHIGETSKKAEVLHKKLPSELRFNDSNEITWKRISANFVNEFSKSVGKEAGSIAPKAIVTGFKLLLGVL